MKITHKVAFIFRGALSCQVKAEISKLKGGRKKRWAHGERIEVEKLRSSEGERGKAEKAEGETVGKKEGRTARIEGGKDKEDRFKLITGRRGK
jgi:hypothetical protein